ncbi:MAG: hypothetical protein UW18_C0003G0090 [Microgenomates group bacterium GW2011_GWF1_44_10]|nr:MAG: hypothetical protein UW18_C0003G0090 [Microgenomates group bacterium GW2011_GWF1_44_10]OGJ41701.1 MAG: hypothetical protein A2378_02350 [Candidatus Pacebacteria bacterium RIFOXYB1_FULL_44_10]
MKHILYLHGRYPDLARYELECLLGRSADGFSNVSLFEFEDDFPYGDALFVSGGSIKSGEVIAEIESDANENVVQAIVERMIQEKVETFSIYAPMSTHDFSSEIKKEMKDRGVSTRFVRGGGFGLSSAQSEHNKATEFGVFRRASQTYLVIFRHFQGVDWFAKKDMGKPYRDARKGMIPPKLARMLVNISRALAIGVQTPTIFDPFCGSGTILMEASELGLPVVESDLDQMSVDGTKKNLEWIANQPEVSSVSRQIQVFLSDATHVDQHVSVNSIDCIITEPFMGKTQPTELEVKNIVRGLDKLYIGAFKSWKKVLCSGAVVCMIFPSFHTRKVVKNMQTTIDKIEALGYTREKNAFQYQHDDRIVQREIHFFRYVAS